MLGIYIAPHIQVFHPIKDALFHAETCVLAHHSWNVLLHFYNTPPRMMTNDVFMICSDLASNPRLFGSEADVLTTTPRLQICISMYYMSKLSSFNQVK